MPVGVEVGFLLVYKFPIISTTLKIWEFLITTRFRLQNVFSSSVD